MPKRKLEEISGTDAISNGPGDRQSDLKRQQLDGLLDQGKKTLFQSLKVARGFERQKLGRRQKTAKTENNDADSARSNAEVSALKVRGSAVQKCPISDSDLTEPGSSYHCGIAPVQNATQNQNSGLGSFFPTICTQHCRRVSKTA